MTSSTSSLKRNAETIASYNAIPNNSSPSASSIENTECLSQPDGGGPRRWSLGAMSPEVKQYLASEVDGQNVTPPLLGYLFMAGYIDAISFSAIFVWCGFQTGNFAQVSLAVARTIESHFLEPRLGILDSIASLPKPDQQSICSLLAFLLGLATFGRLGDRVGTHKRGWLFAGTMIQAVLTLASALTFWVLDGHDTTPPSQWNANATPSDNFLYFFGIACLSASLGVQGIMARRLGTQFSTTIVLTAVFVELVTDPTLFQVTRPVRSRDQKWLGVLSLFLGVVVGRLILGQLGTALTIGVGVLIRIGIAVSWLLIPVVNVNLP